MLVVRWRETSAFALILEMIQTLLLDLDRQPRERDMLLSTPTPAAPLSSQPATAPTPSIVASAQPVELDILSRLNSEAHRVTSAMKAILSPLAKVKNSK